MRCRIIELRYTTDGRHWKQSRMFGSTEVQNVVMGTNYFIQFLAPDNNSIRLQVFSFLDHLLIHNVTVSRDREDHYYLFHHSFIPSGRLTEITLITRNSQRVFR